MTFTALLFCPDEKTARVTTQVLTELEFTVDTCTEPFAAVKKLMGQHFDAIVVDCENEQNAGLLFKSARNSSSNQASLAVAVVEGQAGVANAFRIGANLVLTKPINLEQAKSTLRVARGLLRKGSEAAKPTTTGPTSTSNSSAAPPSTPKQPERAPVASASTTRPSVQAVAPTPTMAPPPKAPVVAKTSLEATSEVVAPKPVAAPTTPESDLFETDQPVEKPAAKQYSWQPVSKPTGSMAASLQRAAAEAEKSTSAARLDSSSGTPAKQEPPFTSAGMSTGGAASAPAPAREIAKPQIPSSAFDAEQAIAATPAPAKAPEKPALLGAAKREKELPLPPSQFASAPTFAALDAPADAASEKSSRTGILVAIVAVVLAAVAYFGYAKFVAGKPAATAPASSAPVTPAATIAEPSLPPSAVVTANTPSSASIASQPPAKTFPAVSKEANDDESDVTVTHPDAEPRLIVKSGLGAKPTPKPESAPDVAAPSIGMNEDQSAISSIVQSTPVAVPKVAAPQQTLRVSQGVTQGLLTKRVQPIYPQQAMQMHIQGAVQVLATISKEGRITNVKILAGDPILARAAADAVSQWRYKPYFLNGEPVEIQTQIAVNFKLP
jgi:protein TonB